MLKRLRAQGPPDGVAAGGLAGDRPRGGGGDQLGLGGGEVGLLEAAPEGLDPEEIGRALLTEPGVVEVHDLHVWEVTSGFPSLSAHVTVKSETDCHTARFHLAELLEESFDIHHSTLQVEYQPERLLEIE